MGKTKIIGLGLVLGLLSVVLLVSGCLPVSGEGEEGTTSIWSMLIFVALFFVMMYFVMIRPQRKKQQEHQRLIDELQRGDRVVTAGGIYGSVESISEDSVLIKTESGATLRMAKGSVTIKQEK
ncbi:preprotein translocase subunit YajC [Chloroflexota bacterium]